MKNYQHYNTHMVCDYTSLLMAIKNVRSHQLFTSVLLDPITGEPTEAEHDRMAAIIQAEGIGNFSLRWVRDHQSWELGPVTP